MSEITVVSASLVIKVSVEDVKPIGGVDIPKLVDLIKKHLGATETPSLNQFNPGQPLGFINGRVSLEGKEIPILRADLAIDTGMFGIIVNSTEDGDLVLDYFARLLENELKYREVIKNSERRYLSNLIVHLDKDLNSYFDKLLLIQKIINEPMQKILGVKEDIALDSLRFSFDPTQLLVSKSSYSPSFVIEKRLNKPFSENKYYSSAPLKTLEHIRVLDEIVRTLNK